LLERSSRLTIIKLTYDPRLS